MLRLFQKKIVMHKIQETRAKRLLVIDIKRCNVTTKGWHKGLNKIRQDTSIHKQTKEKDQEEI